MKTYFIDIESYYDKDYSLRKMTPAEYILDARFEVICLAVKEGINGLPFMVAPENIQAWFNSLDPSDTILVSHNWLFDGCIVAWIYNFVPRLMVCTLGIARATVGHAMTKGCSLKEVARYLGLGVKGETVHKVVGMRRANIIAAGFMDEYEEYCRNDVELCAGVYDKLVRGGTFPVSELVIMDMVLRMAVQPNFTYNRDMLYAHQQSIKAEKDQLLAQAGVCKDDLMSNDKFAALLESVGCELPTKTSPTTGLETWAFSKQDEEFLALEDHENPTVQLLMAARLGHKSTLEETRTERLISISNLTWPVTMGGNIWAPIPLRYAGAHTHRFSGEWKINKQNLRRGGQLRRALTAKDGEEVVTADASQIEARIVATIVGQQDLVGLFAAAVDVYASFASLVFGFDVNKKDHPTERFCGKQAVLGLGYGLGWLKFQARMKTDSINQTGTMITLSDDQAHKIVDTYRGTYNRAPAGWNRLNYDGLRVLANGGGMAFGPVALEKGSILLPNSLRLFYDNLEHRYGSWRFTYGGKPKHIYGGKLLENIVQALARIIVMDAAARIRQRVAKYMLAHQCHDELVYVVPKEFVPTMKGIMVEEMNRRPVWMPDLPLAVECHSGLTYGDAK